MAVSFDPDALGSASDRQMALHLTAPFAAGAAETAIPLNAAGGADVGWHAREPILLVSLKQSLVTGGLLLNPSLLDPASPPQPLPALSFAPYSEAGASLVLYRPQVDPGTRLAAPFSVAINVEQVPPSGPHAAVPANAVALWLELRVVEGILGRLMVALGAEKQRMRRQARELQAMRLLSLARDSALDRMGADVGVPRFTDDIGYDPAAREIITVSRRERDAEYRRRLALYRRTLVPNKRQVTELVNGPGEATDPNAGPLHDLLPAFTSRFTVTDAYNPLAVALLLVARNAAERTIFLDRLRRVHLVWPANDPASDAVHANRFLPAGLRAEQQDLRIALRTRFGFTADAAADPALASVLGDALVRAAACREALGLPRPWPLTRAQKGDGGSRYELGLGANLTLTSADLDQLAAAQSRANRPPAPDPQVEALLASMTARPSADDPAGRWLFEPCGLRTAYRIDANTVYVSHLPFFGMVITGPPVLGGGDNGYDVRLRAAEDRATNAVLDQGLHDAARVWTQQGGEAWAQLPAVDAQALWDKATRNDTAGGVFTQAGLPAMADPKPVVELLKKLPGDLLATLRLGAGLTQKILHGDGANDLRTLLTILADASVSAAIAMATTANDVFLVAAVTGLPAVGVNLLDQRSASFRWYAVPVGAGGSGYVTPIGSHAIFRPARFGGLTLLVVVAYARRGLADPYGFRVDLPPGALLSLPQYEFLMNLLERAYPAGVEVNTFAIRKHHVDLDGDGTADPLPPTISRTYRLFQRRRLRGETAMPVGG